MTSTDTLKQVIYKRKDKNVKSKRKMKTSVKYDFDNFMEDSDDKYDDYYQEYWK